MLGAFVAAAAVLAGGLLPKGSAKAAGTRLRPPGAVEEDEFQSRCIRCFQCGEVCENGCIQFHELEQGLNKAFTPFIHPRTQGCTTCMKCAEVCPTGALQLIEPKTVKMGVARLNEDMCYSFAKPAPRTCGVCYRACPFPGEAMTIGLYEQPKVHPDACVGCGLCEQACVHLPQAIRIIPA